MPELNVRLDDTASCEIVDREVELGEDEALLRVERFGLTANNISYADFGERLDYWRLFPAPDGWGAIPAWGYSRVERTNSDAVEPGQRVFGTVPMGTDLAVRPHRLPVGFIDTAEHRRELSPVYNAYLDVGEQAGDAELVMRPLFTTAVVLDLALGDRPARALLTSASSKTAWSLAHMLRERSVETIGLTSEANVGWVEGLGAYSEVVPYPEAAGVAAGDGSVLIDFAGDRDLLETLHGRLGDSLERSLLVGFTHGVGEVEEQPLAVGPTPEFFFAPTEIAARGRELAERYPAAWSSFAPLFEDRVRIERITGAEALISAYRELSSGRVDPAVAYVASL